MIASAAFPPDLLDKEERDAVIRAAERLWDERQAVSRQWSAIVAAMPPSESPTGGVVEIGALQKFNEGLLSGVLDHIRRGDLEGLASTFYDLSRELIEQDLGSVGGPHFSLDNLYAVARQAMRIMERNLSVATPLEVRANAKLSMHLLMLVSLAYSETREAALKRSQDELERTVAERTAALSKEKALSDTIIETLPGFFFLVDENERLTRWNREVETVSGYSQEYLSRCHALDFFDPTMKPMIAEKMRESFTTGSSAVEAELIAKDGSRHPRWFTSRCVELDSGKFLVGVGIDISDRRRANERIQREKRFADNIIEALPGIFYLFDERGAFLRWNRNFEVVSGYRREEIATMSPLDFFDERDQRVIAERIDEVFGQGQSTAEASFVSKDGTRRPYFFTGKRALVDGFLCLIGMGLDITERKQSEVALQRSRTAQLFALLLESAPDAMVVTDASGAIVFANSQTDRMFGYRRDEVLGHSITDLICERFNGEGALAVDECLPDATLEVEGRRSDGSSFPVEIKLSPLRTDTGPLLTTAVRDITDRKRSENEIHRLNADLERRVDDRTRALARSNSDLEQFAYVASHDLQEPLRAVRSYTQLLERRYREHLDGDAQRYIDSTVSAVGRMQALIADLLAYSRVGLAGKPFGPIDCGSVLHDVLDDLQTAIAETGAAVTYDPLPAVLADRSQLHQLLQNLLGNAIKFRGEATPKVHLSVRPEGNLYAFAVEDNGIGIDAEYADRVFVIFQRLHSRRKYPGTGVGLAICKKIVERHGGRIWIDSTYTGGTRISFQLQGAPDQATINVAKSA